MFPNYNKTRRQYITPKIILEEILEEQGLLRNSWDQTVTGEGGTSTGEGEVRGVKNDFNGSDVVMEFEGGEPITGY